MKAKMKIKNLVLAGVMVLCGAVGVLAMPAQDAVAKTKCPAGSKNDYYDYSVAECNLDNSGDNAGKAVTTKVNTAINVVLGVLGLVAVVMIIIGAISFVTSQGDAAKTTKAKNTILYSVIGLIVALLAFAIVNFVLTGVFGK